MRRRALPRLSISARRGGVDTSLERASGALQVIVGAQGHGLSGEAEPAAKPVHRSINDTTSVVLPTATLAAFFAVLHEPFAALDAFTRLRLQDELLGLWQTRIVHPRFLVPTPLRVAWMKRSGIQAPTATR